jgi:hypothetical protein
MAAAATVFVYYTTWAILIVCGSSLLHGKTAALTLKPYSHSLMHQAPYTRGFHHENGQCAFLLSFWSLVYLRLEHSLGRLLSEKTGSRRRKPRVELRDASIRPTHRKDTGLRVTTNQ